MQMIFPFFFFSDHFYIENQWILQYSIQIVIGADVFSFFFENKVKKVYIFDATWKLTSNRILWTKQSVNAIQMNFTLLHDINAYESRPR